MQKDLESARQAGQIFRHVDGSIAVNQAVSTLYAEIPIASNEFTKDQYTSSVGSVRLGKLLEDLDALAVNAAFKHCAAGLDKGASIEALHLVTACIDRIDIVRPLPRCDLGMTAFVSWTGSSSVEVTVQLRRASDASHAQPLLQAAAVMVRLDANTRKAAPVPQLQLQGEGAHVLSAFQAGVAAQQLRKRERATALERVAPLPQELQFMHTLMNESRRFMQETGLQDVAQIRRLPLCIWEGEGGQGGGAGVLPAEQLPTLPVVAMGQTTTKNIFATQPQDRNTVGAVFGGLLMRRAYELAQATALQFQLACSQRQSKQESEPAMPMPRLMAVDDIAFVRPVEVGRLLQVSAQVVATHNAAVQVAVNCHTVHATCAQAKPVHTNSFHFTFANVHEDSDGTVRAAASGAAVLPDTYAQVMAQIDGKRRLSQAAAQAVHLNSSYSCVFESPPFDAAGTGPAHGDQSR